MKEQDIKDLGFEIQHETIESSGSDKNWYFYTLEIGDICLITSDSEKSTKDGWEVFLFNFNSCVIKDVIDLKDLISILKRNYR
jgi:hypothetical protein